MFVRLATRLQASLAPVVIWATASCNGHSEGEPQLGTTAALEGVLASAVQIGAAFDPAKPGEALADIVDAQLSPDGEWVVALDVVAPFVRVFDMRGELRHAFGEPGEGPGELRDPIALAVGHGAVLVLMLRRIAIFNYEGDLLEERTNLPFWPISASRGCGDEWVVYGPGPSENEETVWLRTITALEEGTSVVLTDTTPMGERSVRRVRHLGRAGDALVLHHDGRTPPETVTFSCPAYAVSRVDTFPALDRAAQFSRVERSGSTARVSLQLGQNLFTGAAPFADGVLLTATVVSPGESETRFIRAASGARGSAHAPVAVRLVDAQPHIAALFAGSEPVPHLLLAGYESLQEALAMPPEDSR